MFIILAKFNEEYLKYVAMLCPSSDTISKKLTACKIQIIALKVNKVNTLINRGKLKSFKGSLGYKKDQKKAIVTLSEGNTIDSSLEIK